MSRYTTAFTQGGRTSLQTDAPVGFDGEPDHHPLRFLDGMVDFAVDMLAGLTMRPPAAVVQVDYKPGGLCVGVYVFADSLQAVEKNHPAASAAARVSEF